MCRPVPHAHAIISGSFTPSNTTLSVPIYYSRQRWHLFIFLMWIMIINNKMKNNKYDTVWTAPISNRKTTNTTLSEQFQYLTEKQQIPHCREQLQYLTEKQQIPHCLNSSNIEQKKQIPHCLNSSNIEQKTKKYRTVGTAPVSNRKTTNTTVGTAPISNRKTTNTTLSEQIQNLIEKQQILHCRNSSNI
jgi:hypothetical protein